MSKSLALILVLLSFSTSWADPIWNFQNFRFGNTDKYASIRAGYIKEASTEIINGQSRTISFRGNVLYYEGLGDSMLNHMPLFKRLSEKGFRVIAFDYKGQGGSGGSMNDMNIDKIIQMGKYAFENMRRKDCEVCDNINLIGWSTGGLASYQQAYQDQGKTVKRVVLIAPGISPNTSVGEGFWHIPPDEISMRSLTSAMYSPGHDPHIDPIKPNSPVKVLFFAKALQNRAEEAHAWDINPKIRGLVLLSDPSVDTYVDATDTEGVLAAHAPYFIRKSYIGARHEIDNETIKISRTAQLDIIEFLTAP